MKVANDQFGQFVAPRIDVGARSIDVRSDASNMRTESHPEKQRWPLGVVLSVLLSLACWAVLAMLVLR